LKKRGSSLLTNDRKGGKADGGKRKKGLKKKREIRGRKNAESGKKASCTRAGNGKQVGGERRNAEKERAGRNSEAKRPANEGSVVSYLPIVGNCERSCREGWARRGGKSEENPLRGVQTSSCL